MMSRFLLLASMATLLGEPAIADWSSDPAENVLVSDNLGDCVITHVAPAPDGGVWVAWHDASDGYDIRLQRLNAEGEPAWPTPLLVAELNMSWVQDFDLSADAAGNAAITWASTNTVGLGASLVEPSGAIRWHHDFSTGEAWSPQICGTTDGDVVVGWMQDGTSRFQRVQADGTLAWPSEVVVSTSGTLIVSDLKPSTAGDVIASFVHYLVFSGAKTLKAQRITTSGSLAWGGSPVSVFTSGSLQYGNFPEFISDSDGGGVFAWYTVSPLMCRLQRVSSSGSLAWGASGIAVTTETSMVHVSPSVCIDPVSGDVSVFWVRQNSLQSESGVQTNRFASDGTAQWGSSGRQVTAVTGAATFDLHATMLGELAVATWLTDPVFGSKRVQAAALTAGGDMEWMPSVQSIGTAVSEKTDLAATATGGQLVACWSGTRLADGQIYAQNVHGDGTLGPGDDCLADLTGDDLVGVDDLLAIIATWGPCLACPEDLDGDSQVGVNDLLIVLEQWGPC
jgi:hypothetical protein